MSGIDGIRIALAESDDDILRCFDLIQELRPHLRREDFVDRVRRQNRQAGYRMAFVDHDDVVRAVSGFRLGEYLAWGMAMYVDDLVTLPNDRSRGYGGRLMDWLRDLAVQAGCDELHLDSGVQRFAAHRFYLMKRMEITSHHFRLKLK